MIKSFRADLHTHTTCSDGSFSPTELLVHAKTLGLAGISITDHDTVNAYSEAIPVAKKLGILLGTGVEFSTWFENISVHVLGYDIDVENPQLKSFCLKHVERRRDRNLEILNKLAQKGMEIKEEELPGSGRLHIATLMVKKKYVATIQDAFRLYIGEDKPCYAPGVPFTLEETASVIHQSKGKIFLAHPHLMEGRNKMRRLLEFPFDGMECRYARLSPKQEKPWVKLAQDRGWLISGGSDFHGIAKPHVPLGCSWVDEASFRAIFFKL